MELLHNNEDYYPECHVFSDKKYDYAIVNGESITRYYGSEPGQYESYPIHMLQGARQILENNPWILRVLSKDEANQRLYKYYDRLVQQLEKSDNIMNEIKENMDMIKKYTTEGKRRIV